MAPALDRIRKGIGPRREKPDEGVGECKRDDRARERGFGAAGLLQEKDWNWADARALWVRDW